MLLGAPAAFSGLAVTGTLGLQTPPIFKEMNFGYNLSLYDKFDDQVLLGVQSGQGIVGSPSSVPLFAAAYVRLPLGSVIVPVATGNLGYAFASSAGLIWRAGGAFDIRNGRHSSLLLGTEYEGHQNDKGGLVFRGGLLLEY